MNQTFLVKLLKFFTKKDINKFSKFIDSPYFNNNKAAILLFGAIKNFYPEFDSALFTKHNIYRQIFPGELFNDSKFRKVLSDLNKLAEKYISIEKLCNDKNLMFNSFLNFKKEKNYFKYVDSNMKNWRNYLNEQSYNIDDNYYYFRFCYDSLKSHFDSFSIKSAFIIENHGLRSLTNYFVLKAMQIICLIKINKFIYGKDYDYPLLGELLSMENSGYFKKEPLISIYCNIVRLFNGSAEENRDLLQQVHSNITKLHNNLRNHEKIFLFWVISQYFVIFSKGNILTEYKSLKWHYLKKQIEIQIEEKEKFSWPVYISIVNNALSQNQTKWVSKFVNESTHMVNYENKSVLLSWGKAKILNFEGKYVESLRELMMIKSYLGNIKYNIDSLIIINYYELGKYNELSYFLQSFKKYLSNTGIIRDKEINKKTGYGFISAVNLLVKLQYTTEVSEKKLIIEKIKKITENRILSINWVREKLKKFTLDEKIK